MAQSTGFVNSAQMSQEPLPIPSIGSDDEESFVVLGNSPTPEREVSFVGHISDIEKHIIEEAQHLSAMEISQILKSEELPKAPDVEKHIEDPLGPTVSIISMTSTDVHNKVESLLDENQRLKDALLQNNINMKNQYERIVAWQKEVQEINESHKQKFTAARARLEKLKGDNANLQLENENLKQECKKLKGSVKGDTDNLKLENIRLNNELQKWKEIKDLQDRELLELKRSINEKEKVIPVHDIKDLELDIANKKVKELEAIIEKNKVANGNIDMEREQWQKDSHALLESRKKIQKLEQELTGSHELITKMEGEFQMQKISSADTAKLQSAEISRLKSELYMASQQTMQKDFEELKNAKQQLMSSQMAITNLQQENANLINQIQAYEKELNKWRTNQMPEDEVSALKYQLEVYKTDFLAEREARESMKSEKDRITEDLQNLQRRNQQLQEEVELMRERDFVVYPKPSEDQRRQTRNSRSEQPQGAASNNSPPLNRYCCPVCNKKFRSVRLLEDHVDHCLNNQH